MKIHPRNTRAAVTICATNYMAKALALRQSFLSFHPESDFYILIIEKKHDRLNNLPADVRLLWAEDLGIKDFVHYAMKFDVIELSTNVKPAALSALLAHYHQVLYIDPDICFYRDIQPVFEKLESHSIVVTPHMLTPTSDGKVPSDVDLLRNGVFNLGFIGVSKSDETSRFLDWWSDRCLEFGFYEPQLGLAVDQKWVDLGQAFFPNMAVLRDPGLNVAFWNLHERVVSKQDGAWLVNGEHPLRFFHFSSFDTDNPHAVARKQSRFAAGSRPDLHELLDDYAARLREFQDESYASFDYGFNYFDDGTFVTPSLRRVYAAFEPRFPANEDPFSQKSALHKFAVTQRLIGKKYGAYRRLSFKEMDSYSWATRVIAIGLRWTLRVVGPNRYFSLMRYLAYISSIRNQTDVFSAGL